MRMIIAITSFLMILGEQGNIELGADITVKSIIKTLILLVIFYLSVRKEMK